MTNQGMGVHASVRKGSGMNGQEDNGFNRGARGGHELGRLNGRRADRTLPLIVSRNSPASARSAIESVGGAKRRYSIVASSRSRAA